MRYARFEVKNFKGIKSLSLGLDRQPGHPVHTLVGLNESGKTTILEALDWFSSPNRYDPNDLVPKRLKANFTGDISVTATLTLGDSDIGAIRKFLKARDFTAETVGPEISVTRRAQYKASVQVLHRVTWHLPVEGRKKRGRVPRNLNEFEELWQKTVAWIKGEMLPPVIYYENFLFDIPDRIYLSGPKIAKGQAEYRDVIQDVLNALGQDLTVQHHLVDRFESGEKNDLDNIRAVLDQAESHITKVVIQAWRDIVKKSDTKLSVTLDGTLYRDEDKGIYLQLRIREGSMTYYIRERSLGFRWFLGFVLFTHFRTFRDNERRNAIFLLDEPASNLHPTAQTKLLGAFAELPGQQPVVYSTHSHHMIRPEWLGNTFVVQNVGMDYSDLGIGYQASLTQIEAERYFSYVSRHPKDTDLYRPILDALEYQPGRLEMVPAIAVVEGKNDFYALHLLRRAVSHQAEIAIYPSTGKDKTEYVVGLYLAWGRDFLVVLDADAGGRRTRDRLRKVFGSVVDNRVVDLSDIDAEWAGHDMEALLARSDQEQLVKMEFPRSPDVTKSKLNTAIQSVLLQNQSVQLSADTLKRAKKLLRYISHHLTVE